MYVTQIINANVSLFVTFSRLNLWTELDESVGLHFEEEHRQFFIPERGRSRG